MTNPLMKHQPVLLNEVLQYLDPHPGDVMIDGTMDGGGHAKAILEKMGEGTLLGVDWDPAMVAARRSEFARNKKVSVVHGNYADLPKILKKEKWPKADGLLLDLGFSSEQLESSGRGFSFSEATQHDPLLMTYDDAQTPVWKILKEIDERSLANVIYEFGGERMSRRIAKAIKEVDRRSLIMTSGELARVIREALGRGYERGRIDPATRTFQALRIYANDELKNLTSILGSLPNIVKSGGRVVILTFHSLEDRIVKQAFQALAKEKKVTLLTKKPIPATREESMKNPRSRSAKLRALILV
jgi:16S rRNA (cytosine1402-N4)-methyltransferase